MVELAFQGRKDGSVSTYRKTVVPGSENSSKVIGEPMPCTFCGAITSHETLRMLGARCVPCFRSYCAEVQPAVDVGDKRKDAKAWAHALRLRELAGERLTAPQREMWRAALRVEVA